MIINEEEMNTTTIQLTKETKQKLYDMKQMHETYEDVVKRLLEEAEA